jgi:hypothetical protein
METQLVPVNTQFFIPTLNNWKERVLREKGDRATTISILLVHTVVI